MIARLVELVRPAAARYRTIEPKLMETWCRENNLLNIANNTLKNVAVVGGNRSYLFLGSLAKLERAIIKWTLNELISKHGFTPVVVPNLLHDHIIDNCGFPTKSVRSQVYKISGNNEKSILDDDGFTDRQTCIAGTSEFALASLHVGDVISDTDLPKRYCALSRCYRAETSSTATEWGIYRVHYFNKVEMFSFTMPCDSNKVHKEFLAIQRNLYEQLGLQFQILDMPEDDLGLSAKKKFDIEAWFGGRKRFGEISSASNCEDYQSSRLNIKFSQMVEKGDQLKIETGYVHTVNGTACSTVRLLIALIEQNQTEDGVRIPDVLVPFMNGINVIPTKKDKKWLSKI